MVGGLEAESESKSLATLAQKLGVGDGEAAGSVSKKDQRGQGEADGLELRLSVG